MTDFMSLSARVAEQAPLASSVSKHFASRPTLRESTKELLSRELTRLYPKLLLETAAVQLFEPLQNDGIRGFGGYRRESLVDTLLGRYLHGRNISLKEGFHFLSVEAGAENPSALAVAMPLIQGLINEWGPQLLVEYAQRLCAYWDQVKPDGSSRWQWLATALQVRLKRHVDRLGKAGQLDNAQGATAMLLVGMPDALERGRYNGDTLTASLVAIDALGAPPNRSAQLTHALVIQRHVSQQQRDLVMLYTPFNGLETFPTLQALAESIGADIGMQWTAEQLELALYAPVGNIFEAQAQAILEQQLAAVETVGNYCRTHAQGIPALELGTEQVTCLFEIDSTEERAKLQELNAALPTWLSGADTRERRNYSLYLASLALLRTEQGGKSFLDGIAPILEFAAQRLVEQIATQWPDAPLASLDDVEVHILTAPNALLSIVNAGDSTLEDEQISLVDFSLFNLSGRPRGRLLIKAREGASLPAWVTSDAIENLIEAADVGGCYLKLLDEKLLKDPVSSAWREQNFGAQLTLQLPMLALQNSVQKLHGFTHTGWRYVDQVLLGDETTASNDPPLVLSQLGFRATPEAAVDKVTNMYVIGAVGGMGPQVLYRPLCQPILRQFEDARALFDAVAEEGELQRSVLDWLDESAQARYANGGFLEPHVVRFGQGSEFAPLSTPAPAQLRLTALAQPLLAQLYRQNVQALTTVASRQSLSTERSRWIGYKALGWTLFNGLMPFLCGPVATAAWLIQTLATLQDALRAQAAGDGQPAEEQMIDLLFNIALVLLAHGAPRAPLDKAYRVRPPVPAAKATARIAPTALEVNQLRGNLDFGWARARHVLSALDQRRLASYAVTAPPAQLAAVPHGTFRGLYLDQDRWLMPLDGQFYPVDVSGEQMRIVDPLRPAEPGPWVERDEVDRWRLDLRLRLRGGGPTGRIAAQRQANSALLLAGNAKLVTFNQRKSALHAEVNNVLTKVEAAVLAKDAASTRALRIEFDAKADSYMQALREVLEVCVDMIRLDPALDRSRDHANILSQLYEVGQEQVVNLRLRSQENQRYADEMEALAALDHLTPAQSKRFFGFVGESTALLEKQIRLTRELLDWKGQLQRMPLEGPRALKEFDATWIETLPVQRWIGMLVDGLGLVCVRKVAEMEAAERMLQAVTEPVRLAAQSHAALQETAQYTLNDRVEVLNSLDLQYAGAKASLDYYRGILGNGLDQPALLRLGELIDELRSQAQETLVPLAREQLKMSRKERRLARDRNIVVTRRRGLVVGQHRARAPGAAQEIIDVIDPIEQRVVASFGKDTVAGDWAQIDEPVARRQTQGSLNALVNKSQQLLKAADKEVLNAWRLVNKPWLPSEVEDQVVAYARHLQDSADAIEQYLTRNNATDLATASHESAEVKAKALREKAAQITEEGRLIRIDMIKRQPPTALRVDYLLRQEAVRIAKVGERKVLRKGRDFMQEYVVNDLEGKALWYAHFHYDQLRGPALAYTRAHLKTVAQRFDGVQTQRAQEMSGEEVIGILRSRIDPPLDQAYLDV